MGCQCSTSNAQKKNSIISKVYHAKGDHETDTLWVSQNDTTVFKAEETIQRRHHQDAVWVMQYELRNPRDGAYYFIYNEDQQLIQEGVYTASYTYEGRINKQGNFFTGYCHGFCLTNVFGLFFQTSAACVAGAPCTRIPIIVNEGVVPRIRTIEPYGRGYTGPPNLKMPSPITTSFRNRAQSASNRRLGLNQDKNA